MIKGKEREIKIKEGASYKIKIQSRMVEAIFLKPFGDFPGSRHPESMW